MCRCSDTITSHLQFQPQPGRTFPQAWTPSSSRCPSPSSIVSPLSALELPTQPSPAQSKSDGANTSGAALCQRKQGRGQGGEVLERHSGLLSQQSLQGGLLAFSAAPGDPSSCHHSQDLYKAPAHQLFPFSTLLSLPLTPVSRNHFLILYLKLGSRRKPNQDRRNQ